MTGYAECKDVSVGSRESNRWSLWSIKISATEHHDDCTNHVAIRSLLYSCRRMQRSN